MLNKKENTINNTLQSWIHWAPTYWIMGASLAYTAYKLGFIQTMVAKLGTKAEEVKPTAQRTATTN